MTSLQATHAKTSRFPGSAPYALRVVALLVVLAARPGLGVTADAVPALDPGAASAKVTQLTQQALSLEFAQALRRAQRGDAQAALQVGRSYQTGVGVDINYRQAERWLRRAAGQGSVEAVVAQGEAHEFGWGVAVDAERARRLYTWAAEQRHQLGFYALGRMYRTGASTIPADQREAFKWFALAASHGHYQATDEKRAAASRLPKLALEYAGYRANAWERGQQAYEAGETRAGTWVMATPEARSAAPARSEDRLTPRAPARMLGPEKYAPDAAAPYQLLDVYQVMNQR